MILPLPHELPSHTEAPELSALRELIAASVRRERQTALLRALLAAVGLSGLGFAGASWFGFAPYIVASCIFFAVLVAGSLLALGRAPDAAQIVTRVDVATQSDYAVQAALEQSPASPFWPHLAKSVAQASAKLTPQALAPRTIGRPLALFALGIAATALSLWGEPAPYIPRPLAPNAAPEGISKELENLCPALEGQNADEAAPILQQIEALTAALATEGPQEEIISALNALQAEASQTLQQVASKGAPHPTAEVTAVETPPADETPLTIDDLPQTNLDTPQSPPGERAGGQNNGMLTDGFQCEEDEMFKCDVRKSDIKNPSSSSNEDIPEQIGEDEFVEGDPADNATHSASGDASATGTVGADLLVSNTQTPPPESAFSDESLRLTSAPPPEGGTPNQDAPAVYQGETITEFPSGSPLSEATWAYTPERPVRRPATSPALREALQNYNPAPEDWR